ncbi:hypothetical protein [Leisingera sp. JC11]|uniref:hypothetical protein n=1 Tax=Leisingera sp. JC11 TaxID=3042469 RepID=UPI0034523820
MSQRTKRGFFKKEEALEKLWAGRRGATQVQTDARINSSEYRAAGRVMEAIDDLAEALTGDPRYFHLNPAPAPISEGQSKCP